MEKSRENYAHDLYHFSFHVYVLDTTPVHPVPINLIHLKHMHHQDDEPMSILEDEDFSNVTSIDNDKSTSSSTHSMSLMDHNEWHISLFGEIVHDLESINSDEVHFPVQQQSFADKIEYSFEEEPIIVRNV